VKLASVATSKAQWRDLLDRYRGREPEPAARPVAVQRREKGVTES
jgi:hypothetical protein